MTSSLASRLGFPRPLGWVGLGVVLGAGFVLTTRNGVDVLAALVAAFLLLLLERKLGDWIADALGSSAASLVVAGLAVAGMIYVDSAGGHASAARFFAAAEGRGYRAAYFRVNDSAPEPDVPAFRSTSPPPVPKTSRDSPVSATLELPASELLGLPGSGQPRARRAATGVRISRLRSSADVAVVGQRVVLRAEVTADDDGELPAIEFSIDGRLIATATTERGSASITWSTKVPGQYVVRARVPGRSRVPVVSALLTIIPGPVAGEPRPRTVS